jgi:uncharacterized protein YdaU (DUF1376 family)
MRLTGLWWWIDRWRKSSAFMDMTLEEQGAYRNLIDEATLRGGPLPNDERILAKACGDALRWRKVRPAVLAHFVLTSDGWRNETLDDVLRTSGEIRTARSEAGKTGAAKRWDRHGKANSKQDGKAITNDVAKGIAPDPDPDQETTS